MCSYTQYTTLTRLTIQDPALAAVNITFEEKGIVNSIIALLVVIHWGWVFDDKSRWTSLICSHQTANVQAPQFKSRALSILLQTSSTTAATVTMNHNSSRHQKLWKIHATEILCMSKTKQTYCQLPKQLHI